MRQRKPPVRNFAATASTRSPIVLPNALPPLAESGLVRRSGDADSAYLFKHALVQESAYETLLKPDRQQLHRATALALEQLYPNQLDEYAARLAEHYAIAEDDAKTLDYSIRAGDVAARLHALAEARVHYTRALQVLERLGASGARASAKMDLLLKLVNTCMYADDPAQNLARLEEAEAIGKQLPSPDGAPGGDRLRLAYVALAKGLIYFLQNNIQRAMESFAQVLPVAQEFNDEDLLTRPSAAIGSVMTMQGHFPQAAPLLERALPLLWRSGDVSNWVIAMGFLGIGLAARGHHAQGLAKAAEAIDAALSSQFQTAIAQAYNLSAFVYMQGEDLPHMLEHGILCERAARESGDRLYQYIGYAIQAWALSRLGQHAEAYEQLENARAIVAHLGVHILGSDWRAAGVSELALGAGKFHEAIQLAEEAVLLAQAVGGIFAEGVARRVWGQALIALEPAQWEAVQTHFATSLQLLLAGEAVMEAARTQLAWGHALLKRGEREAARSHLQIAAAQYEKSGFTDLARQARELGGL